MEVVVGKLAGFCKGVENAIDKANIELEKRKVYCLGEIVHNKQVIEKLEQKGMITVQKIEEIPNNEVVIFRAHGEPKKIYNIAREKNLQIIDLTCGNVKRIHEKVEKESKKSFILILGKKEHPEVIGTKGFSGENSFVIETEEDILDAYIEYEKTHLGSIYIVAQTTFSSSYFDILVKEIETNFIEADIIVDKTICMATEKRQEEMKQMSKVFHTMVIIGGKNSSNTKELVKIAEKECKNVYSIQTVDELKELEISDLKSIGIMAGASTPKESIQEVEEYLKGL